ncbi:hypothetical protein B566_EDAN013114, partial [Ephemera danica]
MKRFVLALLVVLLSLSVLHAKENKKKKDPADDFDIENLNNGEWVAVALEQEPQSSNVFGSDSIRQAINQYVEDSEQQDIPTNSFTLQPPGFQQPHLSVLHSQPSSLQNPPSSNKEPSELEMLYNEFVRRKMQSSTGNPLSANSESYLQQAFGEFLKQNPQQVLQMLKTEQTQPPVNNYNKDPHMNNINNQKNIAAERPQLFNYLSQLQNNDQNPNYNTKQTQQIQSNFEDAQRFSQLQPQQHNGFSHVNQLQGGQKNDNVHPVIPLRDFLTFIRLQSASLDSYKKMPNNMRNMAMEEPQTEAPATEAPSTEAPATEAPTTVDPHDDKSHLLTDNDEFKIARDPNGNAILLSMVDNNGEWPAQSTHYAGHGHATEYVPYAANNRNQYALHLSGNAGSQNYTISSNDFTSIQNFQYDAQKNHDRQIASFSKENNHARDSFLEKRPHITTGFSPTEGSTASFFQSTQSDFGASPNGLVTEQKQPNYLSNWPSTLSHDEQINPKRPSTTASSFPTTVSGQKGQIEGRFSSDFKTTPNFGTGHEFYSQTHDSSQGTTNFYPATSISALSANYESNTQSLATTKSPSGINITDKSHSSNEYQHLTTQYNTSPYSSYDQSLNRQEEIKNSDFQTSTLSVSNSEEPKQTTVPFSTFSKFTTLQTAYPTTELPPIRETTLTDFPTSQTSSDEEEANLPPYNPYPNRPAYTEVSKAPENPSSQLNYGNYLSNYQSNYSPSKKPPPKVPEISYQQYSPTSNNYGRPQANNFYYENYNQQYSPPNFKPQSSVNSYKNNDLYSTLSREPQYASQFNRQSNTYSKVPVNNYETFSNRPHGNYNQQHGVIESQPKPGNSWLVSNYLSSPYYSSEIFSKPEKPSYVENKSPASSYQNVQQSFDSKPNNVQYSSQFSVSSYPKPQSSSYSSQNYGNPQFSGGSSGNYYAFQGGESNSHATVVTVQPPVTTPLSSTSESSLRNSWNIPKLPLQSKQDTDIEESFPPQNNQQFLSIPSNPQITASQDKENYNFASYLQIQSPPSSKPIYGTESEHSPNYLTYPQSPSSNLKPVSVEHEINQNKPDFQSNYPQSSFIPSNGPAPIKYPPSHGNYPRPPGLSPGSSSSSYPSYPSSTHNTKPQNNIQVSLENSYPRPQNSYPKFNQSINPLNTIQDDAELPANSVDQYTGEDLEPVYLPSDNCSTTFMVREDRQSVLGVRAMPGGAAECALTFLSPRQDKRLAFCGEVSTSPAILTESYSALVTVRAQPEDLEPVYLPSDNCSTTFMVREDRQSVLGVRAMPGGAAECALTFLSPRQDKRLALQLLGINMPEEGGKADCNSATVSTSPAILTESYSALVTVRAQPGTQRAGFTILAFL